MKMDFLNIPLGQALLGVLMPVMAHLHILMNERVSVSYSRTDSYQHSFATSDTE